MANSFFQFKQFRIDQDGCAMKVCTDACILGAWYASKLSVPETIFDTGTSTKTILDIGGGTGLLMMMLAQTSNAEIHGIEIEPACFKQMENNISQNKWSSRLKGLLGDAKSYSFSLQYEFIISNPPFYENDLSPEQESKTTCHAQQGIKTGRTC